MRYDITTKRLLEINAKVILQEICGINLERAKLIDLPQEIFTSKTIDSPFFIEIQGREKFTLLLEWQTVWRQEKIIDLITYRSLLLKKYKLPVKTVMVLFKKHGKAQNTYRDNELNFHFDLVKIYELEADYFFKRIEKEQLVEIAPFIPLMKRGLNLLDKVSKLLLNLGDTREKPDLLTALFLFTGVS